MDGTTLQLVLLAAAIVLYLFADWRKVRSEVLDGVVRMRGYLPLATKRTAAIEAPTRLAGPAETVPGTIAALHPPTFPELRQKLHLAAADEPYPFPIGWAIAPSGRAALIFGNLQGSVNHILITGKSDSGKDNAALNILFALCLQHSPQRLQVCVIDGKGLDFAGWQDRAHCWRLALESGEIAPTMRALSAERLRRGRILRAAEVTKWDEYQGNDMPLLVVYVSELTLLQDATSKAELGAWMNSELSAGRAFGMRFIVASQTATNFDTRWRSQVDLFLAGYQPLDSQDEPNTGLTTKKIKELGSVPPSELPEAIEYPGVFCAVQGRKVFTVRTTYLDTNERRRWLAMLPMNTVLERSNAINGRSLGTVNSEQPTPEKAEKVGLVAVRDEQEHPGINVPPSEREQILRLAESGMSRRRIAQEVYGGMGKYDRIRAVLDVPSVEAE